MRTRAEVALLRDFGVATLLIESKKPLRTEKVVYPVAEREAEAISMTEPAVVRASFLSFRRLAVSRPSTPRPSAVWDRKTSSPFWKSIRHHDPEPPFPLGPNASLASFLVFLLTYRSFSKTSIKLCFMNSLVMLSFDAFLECKDCSTAEASALKLRELVDEFNLCLKSS